VNVSSGLISFPSASNLTCYQLRAHTDCSPADHLALLLPHGASRMLNSLILARFHLSLWSLSIGVSKIKGNLPELFVVSNSAKRFSAYMTQTDC